MIVFICVCSYSLNCDDKLLLFLVEERIGFGLYNPVGMCLCLGYSDEDVVCGEWVGALGQGLGW